MRAARVEEGAIIGDECVVEDEAIVSQGVKIYPFKTIEAGAVVHESVIWESRGQRIAVRSSRHLRDRQRRDHPRAGRPARVGVRDDPAQGSGRHDQPRPLARRPSPQARGHLGAQRLGHRRPRPRGHAPAGDAARGDPRRQCGGVMFRTTPGCPTRWTSCSSTPRRRPVAAGAAPARADPAARRVPPCVPRRDRRPLLPARAVESYAQDLLKTVDLAGVADAQLKVVIDCAGGVASPGAAHPARPGRRRRAHRQRPPGRRRPDGDAAERAGRLDRLGDLVGSSGPPSASASTPSASASRLVDEHRPAGGTSGRCSSSSTWSPPSAADAGWPCR